MSLSHSENAIILCCTCVSVLTVRVACRMQMMATSEMRKSRIRHNCTTTSTTLTLVAKMDSVQLFLQRFPAQCLVVETIINVSSPVAAIVQRDGPEVLHLIYRQVDVL